MAGTREGGLKTRKKMIERYGEDFFKKIGAEGGRNGTTGGFYARRDLASSAGRKGGMISRRGKKRDS